MRIERWARLRYDEQDDDQQADDDPQQIQADRLPTGDLVVHLLGLGNGTIEIRTGQCGDGGVRPRNINAE
jgi:hypothetical protein